MAQPEPGVYPLLLGTSRRDKAKFAMGLPSEPFTMPYVAFLIRGRGPVILVDTGVCAPEEAPAAPGSFEQTEEQRLPAALARHGLALDDVEIVIQTHLHWDHVANNRLFRRARFIVQREELRYAAAPLPIHVRGFEAFERGVPAHAGTRYEVIEGDEEIVPGVGVLLTPGHTPGLQSVLVTSDDGACLLASDNVALYECLPDNDWRQFHPAASHVDLEAYFRSIRRITALRVPIVPGHDMRLFEQGNLLAGRLTGGGA